MCVQAAIMNVSGSLATSWGHRHRSGVIHVRQIFLRLLSARCTLVAWRAALLVTLVVLKELVKLACCHPA